MHTDVRVLLWEKSVRPWATQVGERSARGLALPMTHHLCQTLGNLSLTCLKPPWRQRNAHSAALLTRGCLLIIFHFENFSMIQQIWSIMHLGSFDLGLVRLLINLCFLKSLCIAIRSMSVLNGWPCTDICRTWLLISQLMVNLLRYMHASGRYGQKEFKTGTLPGS